jgi:hypothetical protein
MRPIFVAAIRAIVTLCDIVLTVIFIRIYIQQTGHSDPEMWLLFFAPAVFLLNIPLVWHVPKEAKEPITYFALRYRRKCLEESKRIEALKSELSIKK